VYCLDTNIVIDMLRGDETLRKKASSAGSVCISPPILAELFKGAFLADRRDEAIEIVEDFTKNIDMLPLDEESCKTFGQKFAELKATGKPTQEFDLLIGSIALAHGSALVTRNRKDFEQIPGLEVVVW